MSACCGEPDDVARRCLGDGGRCVDRVEAYMSLCDGAEDDAGAAILTRRHRRCVSSGVSCQVCGDAQMETRLLVPAACCMCGGWVGVQRLCSRRLTPPPTSGGPRPAGAHGGDGRSGPEVLLLE